ncbi:intracellular multiplication protein IcmB [Gemmobacter caeni]|uniref:Intracellular multiplication protein IcmB n=1 Tax=Gemmobacter caeni TaxID=589035 RepID=A0A2T6B8W8_9RHOB|nr:ATP-binding protein [Gemmobacter caeni]PTX52504.1 intracellular multiplication protein IcmB [Gemmobacter caeni]TWJ02825.1 intracellular multiplication protein IcmB [Gemmobacter caeni]
MSITSSFARIISTFMNESLADMIRVESMEDDRTLVLKDGTLLSMILLEGALKTPGQDEIADMVERLRIALSPYLSSPGHVISLTFIRDPSAAKREISSLVERTGRAARSLGLDIEDVLAERERVLSRRMVSETCLVSIFSRPDVMSGEEADDARKKAGEVTKKSPVMAQAHSFTKVMDAVFTRHQALAEAVNRSFRIVGQLSRILTVTEALQEMRAALYPSTSPQKAEWQPRLPRWAGETVSAPAAVMMPETEAQMRGRDFSHLFAPSFDLQLATEDCFVENSRTVRIGDRIFSAFDMTLAPETLPDFDELVLDVTSKSNEIPWRCTLQIESGGMHSQALKATFLSIFTFANPIHNRRIREAILALREIDGQMDTVVKFRMSFATWAETSKGDVLRRNAQILNGAVQRWGNSRADGVSGDQLATTLATVPGISMASTAPVAAAPLSNALAMGPIARQASPWKHGSVLFRTDDGKTWPYQPGSSKQTTWVTLLVGTPGSGKSVMMNAINFASAISPSTAGGKDPVLPRIAIIDIGPSSSGMISLIKEALPANRRHEVLFRKLRMSREDAINVFDTQLGMREPTANERTFLINFLTLICGDGTKPPSVAMRGLITACIDRVYEDLKDDKSPRRYLREDEREVDRALDEIGFEAHSETVWWEVVDVLAENGRLYEASIAQRHAVPTIADLVTASQTDQVSSLYASARDPETDQPIMNAFQRMISEVVRDFPILSTYTRFSIGSSRIVSLDLMDVTASGAGPTARRQTAIMYMLARQILTRDFFLDEAEFRSKVNVGVLPSLYLEYHVERARQNLQLPKILCMDEFHRTGKIEMVCDQILQDAREGRKFNVDIKIASQLIEDFPQSIVEIVSSLIVCNAGSENSINYFDRMYGLSEAERYSIRNHLTGPSARGAPVWAMFRLKDEGTVRQRLILTLGPAEIWAFSTTAEDVVLRSRLYEEIGPRLTRQVLARRFPGGSAKAEIEARIAQMEEQGQRVGENERGDVLGALVEDLKRQAFLMENV